MVEAKDVELIPDEGDPLERGIRIAFGVTPELDTPASPSVLGPFRRAGKDPQVRLRGDPEDRAEVVVVAESGHDEPQWLSSRYRVSGEIARGGAGAVLKAVDTDLGREVALKVLLDAHRGNAELTRRFLEEAQIGAQLQHPGIVPVHEIGLLADDRPYFAMKLVKGQTLASLLESRRDLVDERQRFVGIFEHVCQTLAYAHTRGVVHRDLKPANVMVGAFGEVQVMDWGFAKVLGSASAAVDARTTVAPAEDGPRALRTTRSDDDTARSIAGAVMGTPAYMPPEQARGAVSELDERADVFGLGAILCEILTGRPPYTGRSLEEVFGKAKRAELDDARQRLKASGADAELVDLALGCLDAEARERPRNAVVVAKRVSAYLESVERRARELQARAARARLRLVAALSLLAAVVLGGGAYLWVDGERRASERSTGKAVNDAISQAKELRAQAAAGGDPSLWDASLREAKRAHDLARTGNGSVLLDAASVIYNELSAQVKDHRTVAELDRLREERDSDPEELEERFQEVFAAYGIDLDSSDVAASARKVRESAIGTELVLALDQWAVTWGFGPQRRARTRLLEIARLADSDQWRASLRQAVQAQDRERLDKLAADAAAAELAPSTLEVLAFAVRDTPAERGVWLRAQELHPHDFWINLRLGDFLRREREFDRGLQFLRAAVALRPESSYARHKLGSGLADAGDPSGALAELERSIALDPLAPWAYARGAKAIEDRGESIARPQLEKLLKTLATVEQGGRDFHDDGFAVLLAETLRACGEPRRAILALEGAARRRGGAGRGRFPGARRGGYPSLSETLERHRQLVLPDLVSFASIDAAIEEAGPQAFAPERLETFLKAQPADDSGSRARVRYFEGRQLEAAGRPRDAAGVYAEVIRLDDSLPEPTLRLAESLRASGDAAQAVAVLRDALARDDIDYSAPWKLWVRLTFADLKRSAVEALASLPPPRRTQSATAGDDVPGYGAELREILEQLARGDAVAVDCRPPGWRPWPRSRERSPGDLSRGSGPQAMLSAHPWRSFVARGRQGPSWGYELPLPAGTYEVDIEAIDAPSRGGDRGRAAGAGADVVVEGLNGSLERDPATAGSPSPRWIGSVVVDDGFLDIELPRGFGGPAIASIVVRRKR